MSRHAALFLLAAWAAVCRAASACGDCSFKFCDGRAAYAIAPGPDVPFTGPVCLRGAMVDVGRTGEPLFVRRLDSFGISKLAPAVPFSKSFFKAFRIVGQRASGIGHETLVGKQARILDDKCFAVPILEYRALDASGNAVENVRLNASAPANCVAFRTVYNATR